MTIAFDNIRRDYALHDVVARYCPDLTMKGGKYWAICPFHDDSRPTNFNVYTARDGIQRFRCFACDEHGDVIDFVSKIEKCSVTDAVEKITGEKLPPVGTFQGRPPPANKAHLWTPLVPVPLDAAPYQPKFTVNPNDGRTKDYDWCLERQDAYRDADGQLLFFVLKRRHPDGVKQCPVITFCEGPDGERKWCAKRPEPPLPLMGLDDLARYPNHPVMIVEGEACKVGFDENTPPRKDGTPRWVCVTWVGGTNAVQYADWSPLKDRKYYFYADDDEPGRKAMNEIKELIEKSGTG